MFLKKENSEKLTIIQVLLLVGVFSVFFLGSCGDEANEGKAKEEKANEEKANEKNVENIKKELEKKLLQGKNIQGGDKDKLLDAILGGGKPVVYDKIYVWNQGSNTKGKIGESRAAIDKMCSGSDGMPSLVKMAAEKYETKSLVLAHDIDDFKKLIPDGDDVHNNFKVYALPFMSGKEILLSDNYADFRAKPWQKSLKEAGFSGDEDASFWVGSDPSAPGKKHADNYHCENFSADEKGGMGNEAKKGSYELFISKGSQNKKSNSPLMAENDDGCKSIKVLLCLSYPKKDK